MAVATANATPPTATNGPQADPDASMTSAPVAVPKVRKFKASELPLPSATRSAIEDLAHAFKKKGGYDETRKNVWETFEASVCIFSSEYRNRATKSLANMPLSCRNIGIRFRSPSSRLLKRKSNEILPNS